MVIYWHLQPHKWIGSHELKSSKINNQCSIIVFLRGPIKTKHTHKSKQINQFYFIQLTLAPKKTNVFLFKNDLENGGHKVGERLKNKVSKLLMSRTTLIKCVITPHTHTFIVFAHKDVHFGHSDQGYVTIYLPEQTSLRLTFTIIVIFMYLSRLRPKQQRRRFRLRKQSLCYQVWKVSYCVSKYHSNWIPQHLMTVQNDALPDLNVTCHKQWP